MHIVYIEIWPRNGDTTKPTILEEGMQAFQLYDLEQHNFFKRKKIGKIIKEQKVDLPRQGKAKLAILCLTDPMERGSMGHPYVRVSILFL